MAYAYGYPELFSAADKECSESQKGQSDFSSVFRVSAVQTLENKIHFDINFMCNTWKRTIRAIKGSVYFVLYDKFNAYI